MEVQLSEPNNSYITQIQQKIQERKINLKQFFLQKPQSLFFIKYVNKSIYSSIDLQHNQLYNIKFFGTETYLNLTCLELDHNNLKNLESLTNLNAPNLQMLRLQYNKIQNIEPLTRCPFNNLKVIRLFENNISDLMPLMKMPFLDSIQTFWIQNNKISDLSVFKLVQLPQVSWLNLGFNEMSNKCFTKFLSVTTYLNLSNNKFIE